MSAIATAVLGAFTWTLLEYAIHRGLGHGKRKKNPFAVEHIRHHIEGNYFAATWKKVVIASLVGLVACVPAIAVGGTMHGIAFVAGLIAFYGLYELCHRLEHTHAGWSPYGRWARKHHFRHHFVDARTNFGVTTPLWDLVFGTYRKAERIKVPRKLRPAWLVDSTDTFVL